MSELRLDVRHIPPPERHPKVFAAFDALPQAGTLVLVTDHEPRPLRAEFDHKRTGVQWIQRDLGDGRWEVRLSHLDIDASRSPISTTLLKSGIFRGVGDDDINAAVYRARRVCVTRNRVIAGEAIRWPYLAVVERGIVQAALVTAMGREQTMYEVLPNEVFGEVALLDGGHTPLRFTAVTADTVVLLLPTDFVRGIVKRFPIVGEALSAVAAQHFRTLVDRFAGLLSHTTTARVAHALLPYARPDMGLSDALEPLPVLTQSELATRAGTVKEVVSRALGELQRAGAVQRKAGHVVRLDRAKLVAIAEVE